MALLPKHTYLCYNFPTGARQGLCLALLFTDEHLNATLCHKAQVTAWHAPQPGFAA